ncbi:MAG: biopolymer transporter ExbD [Pseudomonadales bacterium]
MRRRLSHRIEEEQGIDLTPMLDVVFIMLIFFIVTASFVKETGADINRPESTTATKQENTSILVAITGQDEIWIDKRRVDVRAVRSNIQRLHAEKPEGTLIIQADKKATAEVIMNVMDAARQAGVSGIALAAQEAL